MSSSKIMVVDDDEKILFAFQQVLEKDGYSCIKVKKGIEAIRKFEQDRPQIVFLDLILPDISGLEVLRQFKQINRSIPVIVISSQRIKQNIMSAMRLGAFEFLIKPLSILKVRETLNKAITLLKNKPSKEKTPKNPVFSESKEKVLNKFEKQFINKQLIRYNGNITAAAKASKMSRQNFYRLLIKHQIKPDELNDKLEKAQNI